MIIEIQQYMNKRKLTQHELATIWGIRPETLNRWLKGQHKISKAYQRFISDKIKNSS